MQFQLPANHTTVLTGIDVFAETRTNELLRGHLATHNNPYMLMYGMSAFSNHESVQDVLFVNDDHEELPTKRYSLVVVNLPGQTVYQNGNVLIEVPPNHHAALTKLSGTVPFLAIVQ